MSIILILDKWKEVGYTCNTKESKTGRLLSISIKKISEKPVSFGDKNERRNEKEKTINTL